VLLSKRDLVTDTQLEAARTAVRSLHPTVRIDVLSRDTAPDIAALSRPMTSRFRAEPVDAAADHEADFRRWTYRRAGSFDRGRLAAAVRALPPQLLRLKGSCRVEGETNPLVFQMVSQSWTLAPLDLAAEQVPDPITLVGVGTADLPADRELDAILDDALVAPLAA
jgi:G3E family GTPase